MTTANNSSCTSLGKFACTVAVLAVVVFLLSGISEAAPTTTVISQPSGVPSAFVNSSRGA